MARGNVHKFLTARERYYPAIILTSFNQESSCLLQALRLMKGVIRNIHKVGALQLTAFVSDIKWCMVKLSVFVNQGVGISCGL